MPNEIPPIPTNTPPVPLVVPAPSVSLPDLKPVAMTNEDQSDKKVETFNLNAKKQDQGMSMLEKLLGKKSGAGPVAGGGKNDSNAFTELFKAKQKPSAPAASAASIAQLLGPKPIISKGSILEAERRKVSTARTVFYIACLLAVAAYAYFYFQLNPKAAGLLAQLKFEPTVGVRFDQTNAEIRKNQTDLNIVRFRKTRLMLDAINVLADKYIATVAQINSEIATDGEKREAVLAADKAAPPLKEMVKSVQKLLAQPAGIDTFSRVPVTAEEREQIYEDELVRTLNEQRAALVQEAQQNNEGIRMIDTVISLVQNKSLRTLLRVQNIDALSHEKLAALLVKLRLEGGDEIASLEKAKAKRVLWSRLIRDIHSTVRKADQFFGQGLFKTVGGFIFSSYRFDAKTGRISISGITKTSDSTTFTRISNLIDSIEKSTKFKDIDFRSFSKARDAEGDYSSGLNLEFSVQPVGEKDSRDESTDPPK